MTLYFDTKTQFLDGDAVSTVCSWHSTQPLYAVASYNQDRGACVTIFDDSVSTLFHYHVYNRFCKCKLFFFFSYKG